MIISMTGFGRDSVSYGHLTIETEIRSLNSRFLDLSVRLPKEFSEYEFKIRELIKHSIKRGKVSLTISVSANKMNSQSETLNNQDVENAISLLNELKRKGNFTGEISLDHMIAMKELFLTENRSELKVDFNVISNSINTAIENMSQMRLQEGIELDIDLKQRIANIEKSLNEIEEIGQINKVEYFERVKLRAAQLVGDLIDNQDRLNLELAILSEKYDTTEECVRLKSHIKLFLDTIETSDDAGRKLNFICQEMNREINTINSKSVFPEISHRGIYIKEELEKIREQVQNIE